jgi:drug/metabolite transporter (DMT)-like permease
MEVVVVVGIGGLRGLLLKLTEAPCRTARVSLEASFRIQCLKSGLVGRSLGLRRNARSAMSHSQFHASFLGCLALLFWGSTIAFSRGLTEKLGVVTAAALVFLLSGTASCLHVLLSPKRRQALGRLPPGYWLGCGSLFVVYMVTLYLAIGLARGRQQVIEVGLLNYLWPSLTLVFSLPILGKRARWSLWPGMVLAGLGVVLAMLQGESWTRESLVANLDENLAPYLLALVAAVSWALYSNCSRPLSGGHEGSGVPVFLLTTGLVLAAFRVFRPEESDWSQNAWLELAYVAVVPTLLAYIFWERAMRRGHVVFVASVSYGTPLLSTLISCLYLEVPMGPWLWVACVLIVVGALVCSRSLVAGKPAWAPRTPA